MVYANKSKSILLYNMSDYKKINEIKRAHNNFISSFGHYLDSIHKRDLPLSNFYFECPYSFLFLKIQIINY